MQKDLTVSDNVTIGGSAINFGNDSNDTIDFSMDIDQDLIPSVDGAVNLGTTNRQWKTLNNSRTVIEDIEIHNNNISVFNTNQDLDLRGSGVGFVKIGDLDFKTNISNAGGDVAISSNSRTQTSFNNCFRIVHRNRWTRSHGIPLRYNTTCNFVSTQQVQHIEWSPDYDKDIQTALPNQYTFLQVLCPQHKSGLRHIRCYCCVPKSNKIRWKHPQLIKWWSRWCNSKWYW